MRLAVPSSLGSRTYSIPHITNSATTPTTNGLPYSEDKPSLTIGSWNVRGWGKGVNNELHKDILFALNLDILCVCETHLTGNENIIVDGYTWIGNNRKLIPNRARKGSGGVGILVKESLLSQYSISTLDDELDGILWVQFTGDSICSDFAMCICYLPPSNSSRGDLSVEFFDQLKSNVHEFQNIDAFWICGDFNAWCGRLTDTIDSNNKSIPDRVVIDTASPNSHGKALIDFLKCTNMCILNGRFREGDAFTSVSNKGLSVVDYCLVPIEYFSKFENFKVHSMLDIVQDHNLHSIGNLPDHSLLVWNFLMEKETTCDDTPSGRASAGDAFLYTMIDEFLTSERVQSTLENSIKKMVDIHDQESLNQIYDEFCQTLKTELVYRKVSLGDHHHKPWWNDCLATLRKNARTVLKRWEMNKQNPSLKEFFLKAQKSFDLEVRRTKRAYHRHLHDKLLSNYRTKPRDFWRQIDKLGIHQE